MERKGKGSHYFLQDKVQVIGEFSDTERKLQELLEKVIEESEKKGLNIKNKEYTVVSKRNSLTCELQIGNTKIKQVQKFNYLRSVLTEDRKCNAKI